MAKKLTGKVALVTGGSHGIGAATALALAEEGTDVIISYAASADKAAEVVRKIEAKGVRGFAIRADQGNVSEAEGLVAKVVEKFGKLDILVNNAAIFVMAPVGVDLDAAAIERQNKDQCGWRVRNDSRCREGSARSRTHHYYWFHCRNAYRLQRRSRLFRDESCRRCLQSCRRQRLGYTQHHSKYSAGGFCRYGYESREQ